MKRNEQKENRIWSIVFFFASDIHNIHSILNRSTMARINLWSVETREKVCVCECCERERKSQRTFTSNNSNKYYGWENVEREMHLNRICCIDSILTTSTDIFIYLRNVQYIDTSHDELLFASSISLLSVDYRFRHLGTVCLQLDLLYLS